MMLSPALLVAYPQVQCLLVKGHFINQNTCMENSVCTFQFCTYTMFILVIPHLCSIWMGVFRFWLMPTIEQWVGGKYRQHIFFYGLFSLRYRWQNDLMVGGINGSGKGMMSLNLSVFWDKLWRVVRILRCTSVLSVGRAVVGLSTHLLLVGLKL